MHSSFLVNIYWVVFKSQPLYSECVIDLKDSERIRDKYTEDRKKGDKLVLKAQSVTDDLNQYPWDAF